MPHWETMLSFLYRSDVLLEMQDCKISSDIDKSSVVFIWKFVWKANKLRWKLKTHVVGDWKVSDMLIYSILAGHVPTCRTEIYKKKFFVGIILTLTTHIDFKIDLSPSTHLHRGFHWIFVLKHVTKINTTKDYFFQCKRGFMVLTANLLIICEILLF